MNYDPPKARVDDAGDDEYRDPSNLARWTIWLLYALIVVTLASIFSGYLDRQMLLAGEGEFDEAAAPRVFLVSVAQLGVFIASGTLCLCWIYRMAFNARIRASYMQYSPGWSVGWYFIPIAYWWKPYQAMKEIWSTSAQQAGSTLEESSTLLGWWWTLWIVQNLISNASFRMALGADSVDVLLQANLFELIGNILQVPLCFVFIAMVKRLTAMQEYAHANPQPVVPDLRTA